MSDALIANLHAALRLIKDEHITPTGRRLIENVIKSHTLPEAADSVKVLRTLGDFAGLPEGSRVATNHNKLLIAYEFAGKVTWSEYGELSVYSPIIEWLPAYLLPPVVDPRADD